MNLSDTILRTYDERPPITDAEHDWMNSIVWRGPFIYIAEPTPLMRKILEDVLGPLDYETPYV